MILDIQGDSCADRAERTEKGEDDSRCHDHRHFSLGDGGRPVDG
jgi:hypothetical protein